MIAYQWNRVPQPVPTRYHLGGVSALLDHAPRLQHLRVSGYMLKQDCTSTPSSEISKVRPTLSTPRQCSRGIPYALCDVELFLSRENADLSESLWPHLVVDILCEYQDRFHRPHIAIAIGTASTGSSSWTATASPSRGTRMAMLRLGVLR